MPAVPRVYVLPRCAVELFTTGDDNTLGTLVWTAAQVDNLRIGERYEVVVRHRTGEPYPERHHTAESHEITFDAVWNINAVMSRNVEYILALTWLDASLGATSKTYVRRYYAKVMTDSRDVSSRDANEMVSSNTLTAAWKTDDVVTTGTPVANAAGDAIC